MKRVWILLILGLLILMTAPLQAQGTDAGLTVQGQYSTTYYARFYDWEVFPALVPMTNLNPQAIYPNRFDLRPEGQIMGSLQGDVSEGRYTIPLPNTPQGSAWFDTDNDPTTPSDVKLFLVGIANGMVYEDYVSRYDFLYTRSYAFNPNDQTWSGSLLAWTDSPQARLPILNGADNIFYSADDEWVTIQRGWNVIEVRPTPQGEQVRAFPADSPRIDLYEPRQLEDVDLTHLSYQEAFLELMSELQRTYVFTEYRNINWQALINQYAPKAAQVTNETEFYALLRTVLYSFYDGHLSIIGAGMPNWMWGRLGMRVYPLADELMVVDVYDLSPIGQSSEIVPGTVILEVNDQNALDYFRTVPRILYSGGHESGDAWSRGDIAFRGVPGTVFRLKYRLPDGRVSTTALETVSIAEVGRSTDLQERPSAGYRLLDGQVGYISIRNFTSASIDDVWDDAMQTMLDADVDGLIIDLRENGGGFSTIANYMIGDFLDEDVYFGREISALDEDDDGQLDIQDEYFYARGRIFDPSRVVVLVGPRCFSACEFAAQGFQDIGATVIGHLPTGGAGGGVGAMYLLPGDTRVYGMAVVRSEDPDGNIIVEGRGVPLDVQVPLTTETLASPQDVLLQTARDWLNSTSGG